MSDDAREMYRPPPVPVPASKRCDLCEAWGDHHTDQCPSLDSDELADPSFVAGVLSQARQQISKKDKGGR